MFKNLTQKQRLTVITIISIFAFIIIASIATAIYRIGKVGVKVYYAPVASMVTINKSRVKNNRTIYLKPGTYEVIVELNHFDSYSTTIEIDKNNHYLVGELAPNDDEGNKIAEKRKLEYQKAEALASKIINEEGKRRIAKYPLLKHLPINNSLYSISYSYDDDKNPVISVKSDYEYLNAAVSKLKNIEDADFTDYDVVFTAKNPYLYPVENFSTDPVDFIKASYAKKEKFYISDVQYYDDDFAGLILYRTDQYTGANYANYRVILKKTEQGWEFAALPQPLYTKKNASQVPIEILKQLNDFEIY